VTARSSLPVSESGLALGEEHHSTIIPLDDRYVNDCLSGVAIDAPAFVKPSRGSRRRLNLGLVPINADCDGDQRNGLDCEIPAVMPIFGYLSDLGECLGDHAPRSIDSDCREATVDGQLHPIHEARIV
jgi:hypothetical protein